ncbi:Protein LTV1-like [Gracilariopsis chorda]|uniref:Protein LTV1-like n=1 Tax=Gracilariopsis chorda TaxID=448386 RepID=A0A2V3J1W3_9FLOR|nr:Protein LTV1-like [Gracilariopsis chorda]|eukprot:PXF48431.1 Protein LTV1-like [Gracilariopsis chorda]
MPRRKRTFIDRSRATTFQLVNAPTDTNRSHHVFVPVTSGDSQQQHSANVQTNPSASVHISDEEEGYKRVDYEYGEYGFPDDGYDYSQHFRPIGGAGGVFMDAVSGLPDPDAVKSSSKHASKSKNHPHSDHVVLKDTQTDAQQPSQSESPHPSDKPWRNPVDEIERIEAIHQIQRERKNNPDLDEIFAQLDSDGDLESTASDAANIDHYLFDELPVGLADDAASVHTSDLLDDDFIAVANTLPANQSQPVDDDLWSNVVKEFREPRLLDEQFDKFMSGFQVDSTDEEYEEFREQLREQADRYENDPAYMTSEQADGLLDDEDLIQGLASLNCDDQSQGPQHDSTIPLPTGFPGASQSRNAREQEFQQYATAEFERGMETLLGSYVRATAEQTLDAFDDVQKTKEAIQIAEEEEKARVDQLTDLGIESDGHDSELDSQFEEMYKEREKWDCETIISTYTNLENHPSVIDAPSGRRRRTAPRNAIIQLDPRTQAPAEFVQERNDTVSEHVTDYGTRRAIANVPARSKGESKADKKARKNAAKLASRERRALKSEMKKAFGEERTKQGRHATTLGKAKVAVKF